MVKLKQSGGHRPGAGRPAGTGKFREKTRPLRIPESLFPQVTELLSYYVNGIQTQYFPLFSNRVSAGFPSPADDHIECKLDLNQHLVKHPAATFFVRVEGDSMIGAGIHENDLLVVDRSLKPSNGKVIIAVLNGELTVKRLKLEENKVILMPENKQYSPILIDETIDFTIWGVVTNVIHAV